MPSTVFDIYWNSGLGRTATLRGFGDRPDLQLDAKTEARTPHREHQTTQGALVGWVRMQTARGRNRGHGKYQGTPWAAGMPNGTKGTRDSLVKRGLFAPAVQPRDSIVKPHDEKLTYQAESYTSRPPATRRTSTWM
jgi:hypothetical protein